MGFSAWAVCKHVIDSGTFGVCFGTFGGIMATIAGIYNIVHSMNDRAALQISQDNSAANTTVVNIAPPSPSVVAPDPTTPDPAVTDTSLPANGQI